MVLGGYGPGYTELSMVEVVRHDRVCRNVISDIPPALARFLGDVSGLAEFVDDKVITVQLQKDRTPSLTTESNMIDECLTPPVLTVQMISEI